VPKSSTLWPSSNSATKNGQIRRGRLIICSGVDSGAWGSRGYGISCLVLPIPVHAYGMARPFLRHRVRCWCQKRERNELMSIMILGVDLGKMDLPGKNGGTFW
jgi:hypothetical protein